MVISAHPQPPPPPSISKYEFLSVKSKQHFSACNVICVVDSQQGGQNVNSEELINKLRVALEPLKNQIDVPMPLINPNEAQQLRPQGQQRHGLLGNAPPGYNPMMGPRSFGPQGTVVFVS